MMNLYKKFKSTNKKVFYIFYIVVVFFCTTSKAFSVDYEKAFFKRGINKYPVEANINGIEYRSYIVYGKNRLEDIVDPRFLKGASILKNNRSIYMYLKLEGGVFVSIDSIDLKTESFKIISFYKKDFLESISNKKDLFYIGHLNLDSFKKQIKINQSLSYKVNNISIYSHIFESYDSSILDNILFYLKGKGYTNIYSSFKDSSFLSTMWEFKIKDKKESGLIYLESVFNNNKNLMFNPIFLTNLDKKDNMEIFLYEIF